MTWPEGSTRRPADLDEKISDFVVGTLIEDRDVRIQRDTPLLNGLITSIALMELVVFLEDEFGVSFEYEDIDEENFGTVERICRFVESKTVAGEGR